MNQPVGIADLDKWLFKGFGGLASAVYNRVKGEGAKVNFDADALGIMQSALSVLKEGMAEYNRLPIGEIELKKFDLALALRFKALADMIYDRIGLGAQVRNAEAELIFTTEASRWISQLIPGLEEFNKRPKT